MGPMQLRRLWYHIKFRYPTREIITIGCVLLVIFWFILGSVQAMQKNYELRRHITAKMQEASVLELEMKTLEYEQRYLQSEEYKRLAVRRRLGYGDPGEKVVILPANSPHLAEVDEQQDARAKESPAPSNVRQWMNFLFGGNVREG